MRKNSKLIKQETNNISNLEILTKINNLITLDSDNIDNLKQELIREYEPESITDYMVLSQILDIFIRLNRLQAHIKETIAHKLNRKDKEKYQQELDKYLQEYSKNLEKELLEVNGTTINEIDKFDLKKYQEIINKKKQEITEKYNLNNFDETRLEYFVEQDNYRKEEYHLVSTLIKLIEYLENRKIEKRNNKIKISLIKAEIESRKIYDY